MPRLTALEVATPPYGRFGLLEEWLAVRLSPCLASLGSSISELQRLQVPPDGYILLLWTTVRPPGVLTMRFDLFLVSWLCRMLPHQSFSS
jgi:hypothetical protein